MKKTCAECNQEMTKGFMANSLFIEGKPMSKRGMKLGIWPHQSQFVSAFACPSCKKVEFYIDEE
jgi:hypothetical protein